MNGGVLLNTDKHRVVQILLNLINNACHAVRETADDRRLIEISSKSVDERVQVRVTDRGVGIEPHVMKQLFRHGFTTRKDGHGFGLHSSANAATELGGKLRAESGGAGTGAAFILDIPMELSTRVAAAA